MQRGAGLKQEIKSCYCARLEEPGLQHAVSKKLCWPRQPRLDGVYEDFSLPAGKETEGEEAAATCRYSRDPTVLRGFLWMPSHVRPCRPCPLSQALTAQTASNLRSSLLACHNYGLQTTRPVRSPQRMHRSPPSKRLDTAGSLVQVSGQRRKTKSGSAAKARWHPSSQLGDDRI